MVRSKSSLARFQFRDSALYRLWLNALKTDPRDHDPLHDPENSKPSSNQLQLAIIAPNLGRGLSGGDYHALRSALVWQHHVGVVVITSRKALLPDQFKDLRVLRCWDPVPILANPSPPLFVLMEFLRTIVLLVALPRTRMSVVVSPSHFFFHSIPAIWLKIRDGSELVVFFHDTLITGKIPLRRSISRIYNNIGLSLMHRFADLVFAVNSNAEKSCFKAGVPGIRVARTSNGVDLPDTSRLLREKKFDACFIGRLHSVKGVNDLPAIWKMVLDIVPQKKLVVIGDGPEKSKLKKRILELGLENTIELAGHVSETQKADLLAYPRVFLYPSYSESWCISIAEAMAYSLPVVAYDLEVYREVFENLVVTSPLGNVVAMAKDVAFLLKNPETAVSLGKRGSSFIKRYDWNRIGTEELSRMSQLFGSIQKESPTRISE